MWQLVSPLPSLWPAASTVVVVGLIGSLTLISDSAADAQLLTAAHTQLVRERSRARDVIRNTHTHTNGETKLSSEVAESWM